jgi:hypothetical protein
LQVEITPRGIELAITSRTKKHGRYLFINESSQAATYAGNMERQFWMCGGEL